MTRCFAARIAIGGLMAVLAVMVPLTAMACSGSWAVVSTPNQGSGNNELLSVTSITATDAWAVGYNGVGTQGNLAEHWNGTTWSAAAAPNQGAGNNELNSVAAISSSDIWAVGEYQGSTNWQTLAEHWNGSAWSIVASPNTSSTLNNILYGVAVAASNDVWAVGSATNASGYNRTLVEHWNGTAWSIVASPNSGTNSNVLNSVAVVGSSDVWAVGYATVGTRDTTLTEHWNGSAWSIVASPNRGASSGNYLNSTTVVSTSDVWAAGYETSAPNTTLIEHWNGTSWSIVASPNQGSSNNQLWGISADSSSSILAVGYSTGTNLTPLIELYNGTSWSLATAATQGSGDSQLVAVAASSANGNWAVGEYTSGSQFATLAEDEGCPTGSLTLTAPGAVNFPAVGLSGLDQSASQTATLTVADTTGSNAGWNVTASGTQFTDGAGHKLPATAVTVASAPSWSCVGGCTLPTNGVSYSPAYVLPTGAATKLCNAAVGTGMGTMNGTVTFQLAVPADTYAGTYTSTWTLSIVSGP